MITLYASRKGIMLGPILLARYLHLQAGHLVIYVNYRQWSILTVNNHHYLELPYPLVYPLARDALLFAFSVCRMYHLSPHLVVARPRAQDIYISKSDFILSRVLAPNHYLRRIFWGTIALRKKLCVLALHAPMSKGSSR